MNVISTMNKYAHPELPGVSVYAWDEIRAGEKQEVLVEVEPNGKIPCHKHSVDAHMVIVEGEAEVLFDKKQLNENDLELNKQVVSKGDLVFFKANMTHGFQASDKGLIFLSINGGIVDESDRHWDMYDLLEK